ncbi:hypothetical protein [Kribbella sp. NPDC049227]|uniref:hypothetical protein n=1 Tax=Kribbella sp. NPDC049227 TaxID=3364113 RepID=UPI00370F7B9F
MDTLIIQTAIGLLLIFVTSSALVSVLTEGAWPENRRPAHGLPIGREGFDALSRLGSLRSTGPESASTELPL